MNRAASGIGRLRCCRLSGPLPHHQPPTEPTRRWAEQGQGHGQHQHKEGGPFMRPKAGFASIL